MTEQSSAAATTTNAAADASATSGQPVTPAATTPPAQPATPAQAATPAATAVTGDLPKPAEPAEPGKEGEGDPKPEVPEKYELTAPEGFTLEPETTKQFEDVARELKLSNDQANKLVPLAAQLVKRNVEQQQAAHQTQVADWLKQAQDDPEIGKDKFDTTVKTARVAVERFATPELKHLLNQTGLGNHPDVIKLFNRIGSAIAEDSLVVAPSGAGSKSTASVLFDHPTSQTQR